MHEFDWIGMICYQLAEHIAHVIIELWGHLLWLKLQSIYIYSEHYYQQSPSNMSKEDERIGELQNCNRIVNYPANTQCYYNVASKLW